MTDVFIKWVAIRLLLFCHCIFSTKFLSTLSSMNTPVCGGAKLHATIEEKITEVSFYVIEGSGIS